MKARIVSKGNFVRIELLADDEDIKKRIPAVRESFVQSIGTTLNQLFGITGEILE